MLSGATAAVWSSLSTDPNGSRVPIRGDTWGWVESAAGLYGVLGAKFVTTSASESHWGSASGAFGLLIQTSVGSAGAAGPYRHADRLAFAVRLSDRQLRFSAKGIDRWIASRLTGRRL